MLMENTVKSIGCLIFFCSALISCGGGGGDVALQAGGEASAVNVNSSGGGSVAIGVSNSNDNSDGSGSGSGSISNVVSPGPTFSELMANSAEADRFGTVIDSAVSGLRYKSGEHYGITDSEGNYGYIQGESVEFFIGGITIATAVEAVARVTPYELGKGNTTTAMNIARFLQTLDNDANPDNGIQINDAVHDLAAGKSLDFSSSDWPGAELRNFVLVNGEWVEAQSDVELLVYELTSATEAGARDLLSASSAMGHLSYTLLEIIFSLGDEAESILSASTCETDSQCKWTSLSRIPAPCSASDKKLVYSEVNADLASFEALEAQRIYLIDMLEKLTDSVWGPDVSRGSCSNSVVPRWAICNADKHCEMTTSFPMQ
jgi:hypothetical protein